MINIRKLETELWESADLLRAGSKLTSNQYCMPVLGLIFLRYAYSRFKMVEGELQRIKEKISELDHWTDKQETKAAVDNLIRDTLWAELPECYDEVSISVYRQRIYEYVYSRYKVA